MEGQVGAICWFVSFATGLGEGVTCDISDITSIDGSSSHILHLKRPFCEGIKMRNCYQGRIQGTPEVFFPGAPPGCPCLCLNDALFVKLIYLFLSLYLSFPPFSSFFFRFLSSFFFFWRPFSDPGAEVPEAPPRIHPWVIVRLP